MRQYRLLTIDTFTTEPFAGNPCAVFPNAVGLTDEQMQSIAREINLSETAFVFPSAKADFRVRYYTPLREIPFAGHPTIATAYAVTIENLVSLQEPVTRIELEFNIGVLPVEIHVENSHPVHVVMTHQVPTFGRRFTANQVAPCFNLQVCDLRSDCPPQVVSTGVPFLIVPALDVSVLGKVEMDRKALSALCDSAGVSAAFMFSVGGFHPDTDTHARFFDPNGIAEDPFTGSASGAMGAYAVRHGLKPGPSLVAEQGHYIGRPGKGVLEILGSPNEITTVRLAAKAVKVLDGTLSVA